ncbi:DUF6090 family protein [Marinoscillum sp.]|uniref:DUF6090 family protein n=1 Tax=Marinoscillum sp. TaxID=2024838 RepID=UPI003BA9A529
MSNKSSILDKMIDLVIVILGISIAFSLNKCQETQKQSEMTAFYLSNMIQELDEDSLGYVYAIKDCDGDLEYLGKVDSLYQSGYPHTLDTLANLVILVNNFNHYAINATSYNSIITTGNVSLINDLDLKKAMVSYYEYDEQILFGEGVFWDYLEDLNDFLNDKLIFYNRQFTDDQVLEYTAMKNNLMKMASSINQKRRIYKQAEKRRLKLKEHILSHTID